VVGFNLALIGVGYCLLAPLLRGRTRLTWLTFAGVALLVGASLVTITLSAGAVAGLSTGPVPCAIAAVALSAAGLLAARLAPSSWRRQHALSDRLAGRSSSPLALVVSTAGAYGVAAVCGLMVFAAFRSSPWLDDAWTFWLPKGIDLSHVGLDQRLFTTDSGFYQLTSPGYPLWWSIITGLDMRFVGRVDLRAVDAELAILVAAFFAAAARLLWGYVRPWILFPTLLTLAASPELLRQSQSGGADLPLAVYVALTVLAAVVWLARGESFFLVLVIVFGAAAASIKVEGPPQLIVLLAVPAAFAWRQAGRRLHWLYASLGLALLLAAPWYVWSEVHGLPHEFPALHTAIDPTYLASRTARVRPTAHELAHQLTNPHEWLLVVPALVVAAVFTSAKERRLLGLLPVLGLAAGCFFWVWVYWAGSLPLSFWLPTSAYRVVDSLLLTAGVLVPLVAERLAPRSEAS
jgi:hypothetical protein